MTTTALHPSELIAQLRVLQANHDALKKRFDRQTTDARRLGDVEPAAHRLALELECLLMDCKDLPTQSRWWNSAHEALAAWQALDQQPHVSLLGLD